MNIKEYADRLAEIFYAKLERKTGWGKEEVKKEFQDARIEILHEIIDEIVS